MQRDARVRNFKKAFNELNSNKEIALKSVIVQKSIMNLDKEAEIFD